MTFSSKCWLALFVSVASLLLLAAEMPKNDLDLELYYSGDWQDAPAYVRNPVTATWGLRDEGGGLTPARCTATLDNRTGDYSPDDARSDLYGQIGRNTPGRVTLPGLTVADGSVSSWAPDRAIKGDAWTDIEITGPAQRVNASTTVISAMRRTLWALTAAGLGPDAYWPLEDGPNTLETESGVSGVRGMTIYDAPLVTQEGVVSFGQGKAPPGSRPVVDMTSGGSLRAYLPDTGAFTAHWAVDWVAAFPLNGGSPDFVAPMIDIISNSGGMSFLSVGATSIPGSEGITGYWQAGERPEDEQAGSLVAETAMPDPYADGLPHHYRLTASQNGTLVDIELYVDGELAAHGEDIITGLSPAATLGAISEIRVNGGGSAGGDFYGSLGQIVVWYDTPPDMVPAAFGYPGELCDERFLRLLDEHNVVGSVYGFTNRTMGPQYPDTLPNLLTEIARTDGGMVYDARGANELQLRTGASLYNQSVGLALTFGVNVAAPLRPQTQDLNITNDVTAERREGGLVHVERSSGPLNVNDPVVDPDGIGRQESRIEVNPETDGALRDVAGWALHTGTWPGARYTDVVVDVGTHPELLADVYALRPGDLVTIDDLEADQVQLLVLGGTDTIPSHQHTVALRCVPAGPYRVAAVGTSGYDRIGSASSTLTSAFVAGVGTSMSVTVTGSLWSTTAAPFHVRAGGVVLNVTAVSGATSPQTFTVSATTVNGVTRTIPAGTAVDVYPPLYVGR